MSFIIYSVPGAMILFNTEFIRSDLTISLTVHCNPSHNLKFATETSRHLLPIGFFYVLLNFLDNGILYYIRLQNSFGITTEDHSLTASINRLKRNKPEQV